MFPIVIVNLVTAVIVVGGDVAVVDIINFCLIDVGSNNNIANYLVHIISLEDVSWQRKRK